MESKFATIIMSIIIILIIAVCSIFGKIIIDEINFQESSIEVEDFKTEIIDEIPEENADNKNTTNTSTNTQNPEIVENPLQQIIDSKEEKNESIITNVDYSKVNIDNYFYNQLEEYSKILYKAFESNQENMKTGTYKVELGNSFASLLNSSNGQEQLLDYYQAALEAYNYDNPKVFYLSPNKMYLNIETITRGNSKTYNVYINNGSEANYLINEYSSKEQVDISIYNIEQIKNNIIANKTGNTYQDIKMVHDYLVNNIEYDRSISKQNIYNIYGALVNKEAVCEGYAKAFKYLMDELGIPCTMVIGKGINSEGKTENHAWNYVQLENKWYAIDVTWDDPIVIGGTASETARYKYFLKGSEEFLQDHTPSGQFTEGSKIFNYPEISRTNW